MNCGDDSRHKAEPAPQANLPAIVLPLVVEPALDVTMTLFRAVIGLKKRSKMD